MCVVRCVSAVETRAQTASKTSNNPNRAIGCERGERRAGYSVESAVEDLAHHSTSLRDNHSTLDVDDDDDVDVDVDDVEQLCGFATSALRFCKLLFNLSGMRLASVKLSRRIRPCAK